MPSRLLKPDDILPDSLKLVGYFARNTAVPPDWSTSPATAHITEIASAGGCVNQVPPGWIEHWLHNDCGFFNSPLDARLVVPADAGGFTLFAYRLLPVRFVEGRREAFDIGDAQVEPLPAGFRSVGFDTANKLYSSYFECTPLSCNYLANEVPVNVHCLVDTLEEAVALAERCSVEQPEPGTYYVLEVLRESAA